MATCSSHIYIPAVIASVNKQMNEAVLTEEIPSSLQLAPSMRATDMREAVVSNKSSRFGESSSCDTDAALLCTLVG
jgi:hypothetical protein